MKSVALNPTPTKEPEKRMIGATEFRPCKRVQYQKPPLSSMEALYNIYENTRVNQPSISGNITFQQYFSIRRDKRSSGTINISDHFDKWESLGMNLGKMHEVSFVVEGYQSSGNFAFNALDVYVNNNQ